MAYSVKFSDDALNDLLNITEYYISELNSPQIAERFLVDVKNTELRLSKLAGSLRVRDEMSTEPYRTIRFKKYKYLMLYKIKNNDDVLVYGIYHMSQDIKAKLAKLK